MLILEKLNNHIPSVTILRTLTIHMPEDLTLTSIQPNKHCKCPPHGQQ